MKIITFQVSDEDVEDVPVRYLGRLHDVLKFPTQFVDVQKEIWLKNVLLGDDYGKDLAYIKIVKNQIKMPGFWLYIDGVMPET